MAVLPARTLALHAFGAAREMAVHERVRTEQWRGAGQRQVQAEFHVFHDVTGREVGTAECLPRKRHAGAHQLAWPAEPEPAQRSHLVFHKPGEFSDFLQWSATGRRVHQVQRLHWPAMVGRQRCQARKRAFANDAVGVDNHDDVRRCVGQSSHAKVQGIALAAQLRVTSLDHLGAGLPGHVGGVIGAIVGNDEDAVVGTELRLQTRQSGEQATLFVVGRDQDGDARTRAGHRCCAAYRTPRQQRLSEQDRYWHQYDAQQHQQGDRKHVNQGTVFLKMDGRGL
jgi:hypothetical protein